MANYNFITIWEIRAPIDKVWQAIKQSEKWPEWWKGAVDVKAIIIEDRYGMGDIFDYKWKSFLQYKLKFRMEITIVDNYKIIAGNANGEVEGTGVWKFYNKNEITRIEYYWNIKTTKRWMSFIEPIGRPFFKWNHNIIMRRGAKGLAKLLTAELLRY